MTSTPALTKRAAQTKLRKLGVTLAEPFDIDDLCSQISRARGRPIRIYEMDWPAGVGASALWMAAETMDYICVDESAPAPLREHAILHELSHIMCDHECTPVNDRLLQFRRLSPTTVKRMLGRTLYDTDEEREAELMASVIGSRINRGQPLAPPVDEHTRQIIHGLAVVMGEGTP